MADHFGQLAACPLLDPVSLHATADRRALILQYRVRDYIDAYFLRLHYSILELLFHAAKSSEISVDQREEIARFTTTPHPAVAGQSGSYLDDFAAFPCQTQ